MRAAVYTAILDQEKAGGVHMENTRLLQMNSSPEGSLLAHLILEYFEFCELDFSLSVFQAECHVVRAVTPRHIPRFSSFTSRKHVIPGEKVWRRL